MKLCSKCGKRFSDDANFCPVDAARLVSVDSVEAAADAMAARFELRERLGGDRTGVVCRAVDKQTHAAVAVKVIAASVTSNAATMQRVERELKQLERIQNSGIAKVIAFGKRDTQMWVATELIEGARSLSEVVRSHGPLSPTQAAEVVEHIGEALIDAAQVGVVHHDLSPKNVLLAGSDIKLINFSFPAPGWENVSGVAEFVSPEQVEGKPPDQRSNIYSLGTLFYFALTGTTPFRGDAAAVHAGHVSGVVTPPSQLVTLAPELDALIVRALERAPSKRYLTVRQFIDEVVRVSRGAVAADPKSTQPMGRVGKHKAELVQTLLGMPGEQLRAAAAALTGPAVLPAPVVAPTSAPAGAARLVTAPAPAFSSSLANQPSVHQPSVVVSAEPSPWSPPSTHDAAPRAMAEAQVAIATAAQAQGSIAPAPVTASAAATVEAAAPAAARDHLVAPVLAAPAAAAISSSSSTRKKKTEEPQTKGKFRETMWFKKGELDAAAAEAAAAERVRTGNEADRDKADSLPMDERYKDDGTISRGDKDKYSLKTGGTQMLPAIRDKSAINSTVSEDDLISELKGGRTKYVAAIIVGILAIAILVVVVATR